MLEKRRSITRASIAALFLVFVVLNTFSTIQLISSALAKSRFFEITAHILLQMSVIANVTWVILLWRKAEKFDHNVKSV